MNTGKVKFFNPDKGFGFIIDDSTGNDVFVHASALNGQRINENDQVEFRTEQGKKGIIAVDISIVR